MKSAVDAATLAKFTSSRRHNPILSLRVSGRYRVPQWVRFRVSVANGRIQMRTEM